MWKFTYKTIAGVRVVDTAIARITRDRITNKRLRLNGPGTKADTLAQRWVQTIGVGPAKPASDDHADQAGHVIARELGGHGELTKEPRNIFPQNPVFNTDPQRPWRKRENDIVKEFEDRKCPIVCVKIVFTYQPTTNRYPARPTLITHDTWVEGKRWPQLMIDNPIENP